VKYAYPADDLTVFIREWRVVGVEPLPSRGMVCKYARSADRLFSGESTIKVTIFTRIDMPGEQVSVTFPNYGRALKTRQLLHSIIPGSQVTFAVEREDTIDGGVEKLD
jgi:hypothetical protein